MEAIFSRPALRHNIQHFCVRDSALGAEHGVGEHVALVVEVILAPLKLSTDYSPLLPKQSKIASPGIAYGKGMKNQAVRVPRSLLGVSNLGIVSKDD